MPIGLGEDPECAVRMRYGGHDRQQAERRVQARAHEAVPAGAARDDIGQPAERSSDAGRVRAILASGVKMARQPVEESEGGERGSGGENQPFELKVLRRIEDRENDETGGVVGDGEQQQEPHGRVARAEHDAADEVAEGDVGGGRDGPAMGEGVVGVRSEKRRDAEIDHDGSGHAAGGGDERRRGLLPAQTAVLENHRFPDFLRGDGEEQRHQHVVHQVLQRQRAVAVDGVPDRRVVPQRVLGEGGVARVVHVRPYQGDHRSEDQKQRIFGDELPDSVHPVTPRCAKMRLLRVADPPAAQPDGPVSERAVILRRPARRRPRSRRRWRRRRCRPRTLSASPAPTRRWPPEWS